MKTFSTLARVALLAALAGASLLPGQAEVVRWRKLDNQPGSYSGGMWLLQDGRVLTQLGNGTGLAILTPNARGSYARGTWSSAGSLLLQKDFYASAVLSDGRVVQMGGEYSGPGLPQTETNFCEVYDPLTQTSTQFNPPDGWTAIGDSPTAVLNDGTVLLGNTQGSGDCGLLDPSTLTWTIVGSETALQGNNEQGYTLLQTGDVLTVNVYHPTSFRYQPQLQNWVRDSDLPVMLGANSEIGPSMTLMDGRVIWFGANGYTAIYTPSADGGNGRWKWGPILPSVTGFASQDQLIAADAPAILEPNGRVLVLATGQLFAPPTFVEYEPGRNECSLLPSPAPYVGNQEYVRMLLLPNGHGLVALDNGDWYDVKFSTAGKAAWAPTITSFPSVVYQYTTVQLTGTQLCGLSECSTYGDDNQQAENYPIVRFVNNSTGRVHYLRATSPSTRSIAPGQVGSVLVNIPYDLPRGSYSVYAVAMGIPSAPITVEVK